MRRRCRVPAVRAAPAASMSRMPTWQPSSAKRTAVARPIPLAPPVSRTRRPESPLIDDPLGGSSATIGRREIGSTAAWPLSPIEDQSNGRFTLPRAQPFLRRQSPQCDEVALVRGRLKAEMGFGPEHVFYSLRKTVATRLEDAQCPEGIAADIIGHVAPMTYGLYSGGPGMATRREWIEKAIHTDHRLGPARSVPRFEPE